jgi:hypothetical protein
MAGKVRGVVDVYATGPVPYVDPAAPPRAAEVVEPEAIHCVIKKGDTPWKIAARYLGGGNRHPGVAYLFGGNCRTKGSARPDSKAYAIAALARWLWQDNAPRGGYTRRSRINRLH